jgi:hypothetical protein
MRKKIGDKFTPFFINNNVKLLNKSGKRLLKSAFRGYESCLIISVLDINSISRMISRFMKDISEMFKNLEEKKSVCFINKGNRCER